MTNEELINEIKSTLEDKFAKEIVMLNISEVSTLGDYFIIATGKNPNQIQAISQAVAEYLLKNNIIIKHHEGGYDTGWVLLDYGNIIIHIFDEEARQFYNLERIWSDAKVIKPT